MMCMYAFCIFFFSMCRHVCLCCERGLIMQVVATWCVVQLDCWFHLTWKCPFCAFWLAA